MAVMKELDGIDNNLEQTQESTESPAAVSRVELSEVHRAANELIVALEHVPDGDLVGEIVANSLKLLRDNTNRGDIKLINKSFKELRYALKIFAPYRDVRKVSIFGSARTPESHDDYRQAHANSASRWRGRLDGHHRRRRRDHGGRPRRRGGRAVVRAGDSPPLRADNQLHIANDPKLINFKYFFTRKLMFVRSSHAIAALPRRVRHDGRRF